MRVSGMVLAAAAALAGLAAGASSSLNSEPALVRYLSNEAPFVVFGVTPAALHARAGEVKLTFIATERLQQVNVFPFARGGPGSATRMTALVACGPRDPGSWDCTVPAAELLAWLDGGEGEFGLRIEAHGDLQDLANHSTVIITVPVKRGRAQVSG